MSLYVYVILFVLIGIGEFAFFYLLDRFHEMRRRNRNHADGK